MNFSIYLSEIKVIDKNNNITQFELKSKSEVAEDIIQYLENYLIQK